MGTLSCSNNLKVAERIKKSLHNKNKKYYELLIGKLNEPKLQNYPFIDTYVLVSCKETQVYGFKDFNRTIVTPFELMVAMGEWKWE